MITLTDALFIILGMACLLGWIWFFYKLLKK